MLGADDWSGEAAVPVIPARVGVKVWLQGREGEARVLLRARSVVLEEGGTLAGAGGSFQVRVQVQDSRELKRGGEERGIGAGGGRDTEEREMGWRGKDKIEMKCA